MKTTIATVHKVAAVMSIARQRAMGQKPQPFAMLSSVERAALRAQAEAAIRALMPLIDRAEKRSWSKGWDDCATRNKEG